MCMGVYTHTHAHMHTCTLTRMCTMCVPSTHRGQKRASDPPKVELEMIMVICSHVGSENQN